MSEPCTCMAKERHLPLFMAEPFSQPWGSPWPSNHRASSRRCTGRPWHKKWHTCPTCCCAKSPSELSWSLPNKESAREKTRSDAADDGAMEKMMRAAIAQVGNAGLLLRHHSSTPSVYLQD